MAMTVKHKYASTIAEGGTSGTVGGYVGPTEWNDFHTLLLGVNAQTGTTYTFVDGDLGLLVTGTNAAAMAYTLPQAGASSTFVNGWFAWVQNRGAGTKTITPTTSTIDGAANLVLTAGQGVMIFSDGSNYYTFRGVPIIVFSQITGKPTTVSGYGITDALQPGVTATITKGFTLTPNNLGNITNFTIDPTAGNYQYGTNHAAATWTAPASDCAVDILVTNDATAGAITFSGFTVSANTGDALTTTNTNKFIVSIRRIGGTSTYIIKALQ